MDPNKQELTPITPEETFTEESQIPATIGTPEDLKDAPAATDPAESSDLVTKKGEAYPL